MSVSSRKPSGFLTLTLHAHLPYVVNHGTWPHGIEWLHEAVAETYLPLLRVLGRLEKDGISLHCNLNISPVLLEQLAHPVFQSDFPKYLERKIVAASEDESVFIYTDEHRYAETARFWHHFFSEALIDFEALDRNLVSAFRHFNDVGLIEIITSGATHGYMPLLGTDESVRAQIRTGVAVHEQHIGKFPRGIWSPECGYRPAGPWGYPIKRDDGSEFTPAFDRIGIEQAISESGLEFFFVDTHLVEESAQVSSPYGKSPQNAGKPQPSSVSQDARKLYQPYYVEGPYARAGKGLAATVFPRDPRTGVQVWSGDTGYPGDSNYLDFHKKRWPGGHRYWRVTGPRVDMGSKEPYFPHEAAERTRVHAENFVHLVEEALQAASSETVPPILCAPFDAELFGHWWFEGPLWLESVARLLHERATGLELISCSKYLELYPRAGLISMHEGSWGAEGNNQVWLNSETSWTYNHIYAAELYTREVCTLEAWKGNRTAERIVKQLCRELLLLESSDWQFLITTGAARDYAELRFNTHNAYFNELKAIWQSFEASHSLAPEQEEALAAIELRDSIFRDIDPRLWATGAHEVRSGIPTFIPPSDPGTVEAPSPASASISEGSTNEVLKLLTGATP